MVEDASSAAIPGDHRIGRGVGRQVPDSAKYKKSLIFVLPKVEYQPNLHLLATGRLCLVSLKLPLLLKAVISAPGENDVIEESDSQGGRGSFELPSHLTILFARSRVARRVVVRQDDRIRMV
jgi:hypothetical protein